MQMLKLQLNTESAYNRDMQVTLTNQVTGAVVTAKPFLDGSVTVPNADAGPWRLQVKHPNLVFDLFDRNIHVFKDRPTLIPVTIPKDIFKNTPIRDTPEADLGPVEQKLDGLTQSAEQQSNKLGGQPIYADDWNQLALTVADACRSTRELTSLVAPVGHDHPELVERIEEIQGNIQRFFDAFGEAIAQLQRQIQQLALQSKVESTLGKLPDIDLATRQRIESITQELGEVWQESPAVYSARKRRVGQQLQEELSALLADAAPTIRDDPVVKELDLFSSTMAAEPSVTTYVHEIAQNQRTNRTSTAGVFTEALKAGRTRSL